MSSCERRIVGAGGHVEDTVRVRTELIEPSVQTNVSSTVAGGRGRPTELRLRGIQQLKVVRKQNVAMHKIDL